MSEEDNIDIIFSKNELQNLKTFIDNKKYINSMNFYLMYMFHLCQGASVLCTTLSTTFGHSLLWIGVALSIGASIINSIEKVNSAYLTKINKDVIKIKQHKYIIESDINIDIENKRRQSAISMLNSNQDEIPEQK